LVSTQLSDHVTTIRADGLFKAILHFLLVWVKSTVRLSVEKFFAVPEDKVNPPHEAALLELVLDFPQLGNMNSIHDGGVLEEDLLGEHVDELVGWEL